MKFVLVGLPGVGKSLIGKALAARLKLSFFDADDYIDNKYSEHFRTLEKLVLRLLLKQEGVLATGGGCVLDSEIRTWLSAENTIWLQADINDIMERIQGTDRLVKDREKLLERFNLYQECSKLTVNTTGKTMSEIVEEIVLANAIFG